jgi:hypothetical protein
MNVEEIIRLQAQLESKDAILRSRWQDEANYIFPRESNITDISLPGSSGKVVVYDTTAITEADNMNSGLLTNLVPAGQKYFSLTTSDNEVKELDTVKSYMAKATENLHEELFSSNYILQLTETLMSLIVHGTGNLFSEYRGGLNFTDWDISRYQILENFQGQVDTMFLKFPKTAKQAYEKWGDKAGESVVTAATSTDQKKIDDTFWFIHLTRPRKNWNPRYEDNLSLSFESLYIAVKDKILIEEGGYPEFPYSVPRWKKTTGEAHGRGIGAMILPQVKMVNANKRDFNRLSNIISDPPMDVLQSFTGTYKTFPHARNNVMEFPTAQSSNQGNFGNFPTNKDTLIMERQVIKDAFYADAFAPITSTGTGDRRNEMEIRQRVMEAFRKIGTPIGRLESELFTPQITRCFMLLVRNKVIDPPPPELQGKNLKIVYLGPLSLAQQSSEVSASKRWVGAVIEAEANSPAFAGASDNVNIDKTVRRWGRIEGVNEDDISTESEVAEKRAQRQADAERQRDLEEAQVAAGAYGQTTKAPEPGSAAEQLGGA